MGIFPPKIKIEDLKNFNIKDENIVSFQKISAEVPFLSLFSKNRMVNLYVHKPTIILNEKIFKKGKKKASPKLPFKINRINIIDGELFFTSKKLTVNLLKFNLSSFTKSHKTVYRLTSPHLKIIFLLKRKEMKVEGHMETEFRPQRTCVKISRFFWNTEDLRISLNGRVFTNGTIALNVSAKGDPERILYPVIKNMRPLGYMESNTRIRRKKKETLKIDADFGYNNFTVQGEAFKNLRGTFKWNNLDKLIRVDTIFNDGPLDTHFQVRSRRRLTRIHMENISAKKVTKILKLNHEPPSWLHKWDISVKSLIRILKFNYPEWPGWLSAENKSADELIKELSKFRIAPLGGVVRRGDIEIRRGITTGTAVLEPEPVSGTGTLPKTTETFYLRGDINYRYNSRTKSVNVFAKNMKTEFGTMNFLEVESDPSKKTKLKVRLKANVNGMGELNKYTKHYINVDLSPWKFGKGKGVITLDLKKIGKSFVVDSDLDIRNFTSSSEPIDSLTGHISTKDNLTIGTFSIMDKDLKGKMELSMGKDRFQIDFKDVVGKTQKILNILELDLSITGGMKGNFLVDKKYNEPLYRVKGDFQAKQVHFYNFVFDDVEGELDWELEQYISIPFENIEFKDVLSKKLQLKNFHFFYNGGKGDGDIFIDYAKEIYSLEGKIKGIDVSRIHPEFVGRGDIYFKGNGVFDYDPIEFNYNSKDLYFYKGRKFITKGTGEIFTDFSDFHMKTRGEVSNEISASPFTFQLKEEQGNYSGSFDLTLTDLNLLIPWGNNSGTMELEGQILDSGDGEVTTEGHAVFKGRFFSFPNFPHALENFQGDIIFKDLNFTLRSLQGTMGGGKVESSGYLDIKNNQLDDLFISFVGKKMNLYPIDRSSFTLNADLNLKYIDKKLLLSGQLDALSGIWKREVDEGVTFNTDPSLSSSGSKIMDMLEFDLKLMCIKDIQVDNSFVKATGKFDLRLTGNTDFPILMGVVEFREGEVYFSDKKFDLVRGKLVFNNKFMIDPLINFESESFLKNYRVKFTIRGTASRPKPELSSSPPLPPGDIMTLISVGELFERPTSAELSSRIGTVTTSLLASELTEAIRKRTRKIFGDFLLNIDPNISEIEGVSKSRLIVGKEISKNFLIVVATNFTTQRQQQVVYLQYHLTPSLSLIGMKNEEGRYSLDLRFRKRH